MSTNRANGQLALYTDNAGKPGTLVVASVKQALVTGANTLKVSSPVTVKAGKYWLTHVWTGGFGNVTLREGTTSNAMTFYLSAASFPSSYGGTSNYIDHQFADWVIGY